LQSTVSSVTFYEQFGFRRVGAIAKYADIGIDINDAPTVGYRHWTFKDERNLEGHGAPSYMMALKLQKGKNPTMRALQKALVDKPPPLIADPSLSTAKKPSKRKRSGREEGSQQQPAKNLFNKIVELRSGVADGEARQHRYWFLLHYDPDNQQCRLCPLEESGVFKSQDRAGRTRWKVVPEGKAHELEVSIEQFVVIKAETVKKTKDVEKEVWDIWEGDEAAKGKRRKSRAASPSQPSAKKRIGKSTSATESKKKNKAIKAKENKAAPPQIVVGNTHRMLHRKKVQTERGDTALHKWTAFVRAADGKSTPPPEAAISKVVFHLHPSCKPSVVTATKAPFEVTQVGWGTFDIEIDIHRSNGQIDNTAIPLQFTKGLNTAELELPCVE